MDLLGKSAVVTGASTGIGRAIAIELARNGAFVALVGRTEDKLLETKNLITMQDGKAEIFLADLTNHNSIEAFIILLKKKIKIIDILVNVAGIWHGKNEVYANMDFETLPKKIILDTYYVGLIAPTLLVHGLISYMSKKGKIINISGTFESGARGWLPYYVSKRAVEDLTIGLSEELKEKDIHVNAISPSDTATDAYKKYFPQYVKDAINPEEIGKFVVKLCEESTTGKVFVLKKDKEPFEAFHY